MLPLGFLAALAIAGCGVDGQTCGRGRCTIGVCISVFGDETHLIGGRINQGWMEPHFPNVDNEFWCERPCPKSKTCARDCLENPADDGEIVCNGDTVDVIFFSAGKSCLCDPAKRCYNDQQVSGMDVTDTCSPTHNVLKMCVPNQDCDAGTFHTGDQVPGVRLYSAGSNIELLYCPGLPEPNAFGNNLPEGKSLRIYADNSACPP